MELMHDCMEDIDPMDSEEALNHAINEKSSIIIEAAQRYSVENGGGGLYLRPYAKGMGMDTEESSSSSSDDDEMGEKIWKMIAYRSHPYDNDPFSSLKFFIRLHHCIDHDEVFQQVLKKTQALRDDDNLTFKEALDKTIEKEKSLIYRAFTNNATEEKCSSGGDEDTSVWCLMLQEVENYDNLDVLDTFKIYVLYYRGLKHDNVFQAIMETLELSRKGANMNFKEAFDFAVEENKSLILQALRKAGKDWALSNPDSLNT